jgi:hypothetical protein
MARDQNLIEPLEISFTVNEQTGWYLDRMIEMGVYGNSRREAAKIALYDHCKMLVGQEKMKVAPPPKGSAALTVGSG